MTEQGNTEATAKATEQNEEIETQMLETVREEIGYINDDSGGDYFYAVAEVMGRYIVRQLKVDGSLIEQTLEEFYKEIAD